MKIKNTILTSLALASCLGALSSQAASGTWTNINGGSWANTNNWSGGTNASGSGFTADFSTLSLPANAAVTLDGNQSITTLIFDDLNVTKHNWALNTGSSGTLTLSGAGAGFTVNSATNTVNAALAGTVGLTKAGAGTLVLSLAPGYTSHTTNNAGTLRFMGHVNTYTNQAIVVKSSATVESAATLYINVANAANRGTASTNVLGAGTLRLVSTTNSASASDLYFGLDHSTTSYYGAWLNPATLDLGSAQRFIFARTGHNSMSQYYPNTDAAIGSSIIGSGGITYIAQMTWAASNPMEVPLALAGSNTFTGPLEIQRGSVYLVNPSALTQTNVLFLNCSGTNNARFFLYGNSVAVADLSSSTSTTTNVNLIANGNAATGIKLALTNATLTVVQNHALTFSGKLVDAQAEYNLAGTNAQGFLALDKEGSAMLTLSGTNTYTGPTTVNGGTLAMGGAGLLGSGAYAALITNNATFAYNSSASQTLSGVMAGTGALSVSSGTLTLSGTNTYSGGTTLSGGTLAVGNGSAIGTGTLNANLAASATLTIANTSALTLTNNIVLGAPGSALTLSVIKNSPGILTGTPLNLTGNISGGNGNLRLFLNSNTGSDNSTTYRFPGTNTFVVSRVELNRGGIVVVNPASLGNPANLVYLDGNSNPTLGDLRFENSMTFPNPIEFVSGGSRYMSTDTNDVVLTGGISGVTLTKLGTGKLTLTTPATHTGNTTISAGTLALTGSATMASTPVITLNNTTLDGSALSSPLVLGGSQTLQGTSNGVATVLGDVQDSAGTIIIPGGTGTVGTLRFGGSLALAGSETLNFDLGKTPTSAGGTNNDLITVASNLTINAGTVVNINPLLALAGGTYKLITYGGTLTGAGNTASWTVGSYTPSGRVTGVAISEATPGEIDLIVTGSPAPLVWRGDGAINAWDVQTTTDWLNGAVADSFYQFDNVTFDDTGTNTPAVDIQGPVTPSSVTVSGTKHYTFNSSVGQSIGGGGSLTKSGPGTLTILNANGYTGLTTINAGTLELGDGGTYDGALTASPITNNATLKFNVGAVQTASAPISGPGQVVVAGQATGFLTLNAANTWTGGLNLQSGTTKPGVNNALPAGASVTVAPGAAYDFNGIVNGSTTTNAYSFTIAGAGPDGVSGALVNSGVQVLSYASVSNVTLAADATLGGNNGRWDVGPSTNSTLNGQGFNLTKAGSCLLNVRPQIVTNVATITVASGELRYESYNQTNAWTSATTNYVASGASLGSYGVTVNYPLVVNGGTVQSDSGTATWTGNALVNAGSVFSTATGAQVFSGVVAGTSGLTIQGGTGSVTLAGTNTYSGGTTINAGTLVVANENALGTGDATINTGSLYFNFPVGTTNVVTNNISLPATGTQEFTLQGNPTNFTTVRLTGLISGGTPGQQYNLLDTGVTGNHHNVLVLDNPNNNFYGNILMNRGTLGFTSDAALGNVATISIDTWNVNGQLRFDAPNLTLSASRTIDLHTSGYVMPINVQGYNGTVDAVISGPGTLVKQGTGTLTLTAVNTYTGPTTVTAGKLSVNGTLAAASAVTVQTNATLQGIGTVNGAVTVQAGGTVAPGNSVGTLNTGNENWNGGGAYAFELKDAADTNTWDLLNITGTLGIQAAATNQFTVKLISLTSGGAPGPIAGFGANTNYSWTFVTAATITNFDAASFVVDASAFSNTVTGTFSVTNNGTSLAINYTVSSTPPPPTVVLNTPTNGAVYAAFDSIPLAATVTDNGTGITSVEFLTNGTVFATVTALPYTNVWTSAAPGAYAVIARAVYGSGYVDATNSITVNALPPPSVVLNTPANGSTYAAFARIPLTATVTGNGNTITNVQFLTNGTVYATVLAAPYTNLWTMAVPSGYSVIARVNSSGGVVDATNSMTVNALQTPAVVAGSIKRNANGFSFSFTGPQGQPYHILSTTNVTTSLGIWDVLVSDFFDATGTVNYTNATPSDAKRFYRVKSP